MVGAEVGGQLSGILCRSQFVLHLVLHYDPALPLTLGLLLTLHSFFLAGAATLLLRISLLLLYFLWLLDALRLEARSPRALR